MTAGERMAVKMTVCVRTAVKMTVCERHGGQIITDTQRAAKRMGVCPQAI